MTRTTLMVVALALVASVAVGALVGGMAGSGQRSQLPAAERLVATAAVAVPTGTPEISEITRTSPQPSPLSPIASTSPASPTIPAPSRSSATAARSTSVPIAELTLTRAVPTTSPAMTGGTPTIAPMSRQEPAPTSAQLPSFGT